MTNKTLTLEQAFNSTFHKKFNFDDFINLDIRSEYKDFTVGKNKVYNPSDKLRNYHKFIKNFIFEYADINSSVHSYLKNKSAYTAVKKHEKSSYFFQTDFEKFFHSITTDDVAKVLQNSVIKSPISDIPKYTNQLLNLVMIENTLPVGFSTSPIISNSCMFEFDTKIQTYCSENKIIYTRYSDDLIFSSDLNELKGIEDTITKTLYELFVDRLHLNYKKTKYIQKGSKVKLLGMVILPNGKISVDNKIKNKVEVLLHFYINDKKKFNDYLYNVYKEEISTLSGQLNYINTIDPDYLLKLRKKYGNYIIDSFFHKSVKS